MHRVLLLLGKKANAIARECFFPSRHLSQQNSNLLHGGSSCELDTLSAGASSAPELQIAE